MEYLYFGHNPATVSGVKPRNELTGQFTTEEIIFGIDQWANKEIGMSGSEFIAKVRAGEPVHQLHTKALDIADLVWLLPEEGTSAN